MHILYLMHAVARVVETTNKKAMLTRAVPNIRFVFASAPNSGPNRLFVFGRIVLTRPNTNSA